MEIQWYWLAERLGLVRDIFHLYEKDGFTCYEVSAKADDFFGTLTRLLILLMFLVGLLIRLYAVRRGGRKGRQSDGFGLRGSAVVCAAAGGRLGKGIARRKRNASRNKSEGLLCGQYPKNVQEKEEFGSRIRIV